MLERPLEQWWPNRRSASRAATSRIAPRGISVAGAVSGCGFFTLSNLVFSADNQLLSVRVTLNCGTGAILDAFATCGVMCSPGTIDGEQATFNCA